MLENVSDVVRALKRYRDIFDLRSDSCVVVTRRRPDPFSDPFGPRFLQTIEERDDLLRRLRRLEHRSRLVLMLWYCFDWAAPRIARHIGVSRQHTYRIRDGALDAMVEEGAGESKEEQTAGSNRKSGRSIPTP